ncbi:MAG: hypothetical protein ACFBWO_15680 [Paracoccaceae bacterium]
MDEGAEREPLAPTRSGADTRAGSSVRRRTSPASPCPIARTRMPDSVSSRMMARLSHGREGAARDRNTK